MGKRHFIARALVDAALSGRGSCCAEIDDLRQAFMQGRVIVEPNAIHSPRQEQGHLQHLLWEYRINLVFRVLRLAGVRSPSLWTSGVTPRNAELEDC